MSLRRAARSLLAGTMLAAVLMPLASGRGEAATLPSGFQEQIVFSGLTQPTNIEFAPDGRVFVAQKNGVIKIYDNLADPTPDVFADLSVAVHNQWDRGLLGLALAPNFPTSPWVYVLYTYDAPLGQTAPVWNDVCPDANNGNCIVSARLARLQANGNQMTGSEQVLISDWCQQYPSHSIGDLHFGADGALYVSGGDGASFNITDYGQTGTPVNPCGDPPGGAMSPPTAEGGALRSQDVRTLTDPTGLNGAILRLDPTTGAALPNNPLAGSSDLNARRIVAHGVRNPFRFTIRPGTNEVWAGDVGWSTWEEIDRVVNPIAGVTNFGWPCYEGNPTQPGYDSANLNLCETLYSGGGHTTPYYAYNHSAKVVPGETCPTGGSSITGLAFYPAAGGPYPSTYNGALFFADYSRGPRRRTRQRALLRRPQRRHHPAHPVLPQQPAAGGGAGRHPDLGHRAAHRQLRRPQLHRRRPGRPGSAELRVGLHQRRHGGRHHRDGEPHLCGRNVHRPPDGDRHAGRQRHEDGHHLGREQRPHGGDRRSGVVVDVGGW